MEAKFYNVSHNTCLKDQEEISEVEWIIPDYILLLSKRRNQELIMSVDKENSKGTICAMQFRVNIYRSTILQIDYRTLVNVYLKYSVTAIDKNEQSMANKTRDYNWYTANVWSDLFNVEMNSQFNNRYIRIKFNFRILVTSVDYGTIISDEELTNTSICRLNTHLEKLLFNPLLSDVTIKSVEGDEIRAHKLLLITHSAVLKAHFEHDTVESSSNIVETPLVTAVLKEVLTYIYTYKAPKLDQMAKKLLAAADYYQLIELKGICEKALHKQLTVDNAIDSLELATLYTATKLKDLTLEFIHGGNAGAVIKTEAWKKSQSIELVKMIHECGVMNN